MSSAAAPGAPVRAGGAAHLPLLDAVKGLACLLIVGHHLCRYGPMPEAAAQLAPRLMQWLAQEARLAVQVFLVLGGYLAAASLAPSGRLHDQAGWTRLGQRYLRLVLPLLAALLLTMLAAALAQPFLDDPMVPAAPTAEQVLAHGLLLHDLLGFDALSTGVWYVAIDFQLYALALLLLAAARALPVGSAARPRPAWPAMVLVLAGVAASLVDYNRQSDLDVWAIYFFGAYGLGMLAFWLGRVRHGGAWAAGLALLMAVGGAALALEWRSRIALALASALMLALAQRGGWLQAPPPWLAPRWLRGLGGISYSLFLSHFAVLLAANACVAAWGVTDPWANVLAMAATVALAIAVGAALHWLVEARRLPWRAWLALMGAMLAGAVLVD